MATVYDMTVGHLIWIVCLSVALSCVLVLMMMWV
jgi:hypothetical protein